MPSLFRQLSSRSAKNTTPHQINLSAKLDRTPSFKQGTIRDCGLLAALYGLSSHPNRQDLLKDVDVLEVTKPNGKVSYTVQFPECKPVTIDARELDQPIKTPELTLNRKRPFPVHIDPTKDRKPVQGNHYISLLERAFIKLREEVKQQRFKIPFLSKPQQEHNPLEKVEGILPNEALARLFGENHHQFCVTTATYDDPAFTKAIGKRPRVSLPFKANPTTANFVKEIFHHLAELPEPIYIVTACTADRLDPLSKRPIVVGNKQFSPKHAYTISKINPTQETLTLINPHNTEQPVHLTYDEFLAAFAVISGFSVKKEHPEHSNQE